MGGWGVARLSMRPSANAIFQLGVYTNFAARECVGSANCKKCTSAPLSLRIDKFACDTSLARKLI
jgi:hypothetical protein